MVYWPAETMYNYIVWLLLTLTMACLSAYTFDYVPERNLEVILRCIRLLYWQAPWGRGIKGGRLGKKRGQNWCGWTRQEIGMPDTEQEPFLGWPLLRNYSENLKLWSSERSETEAENIVKQSSYLSEYKRWGPHLDDVLITVDALNLDWIQISKR